MTERLRYAFNSLRLLWRQPLSVALLALLLGAIILNVQTSLPDAFHVVGWRSGLSEAIEQFCSWGSFSLATLTAIWVGSRLEGEERRRDLFLAGDTPRAVSAALAMAATVLGSAWLLACAAVSTLLAASVYSHGSQPFVGPVDQVLQETPIPVSAGFIVLVPLVWSIIGALIGSAARSRGGAAVSVATLLAASVLLERVATSRPLFLDLHSISPLGLTQAMVLGESIPGFPPSGQSPRASAALLATWCIGLVVLSASRRDGRRVDALAQTDQASEMTTRRWIGLVTGGLSLVLAGYLLPTYVGDRIPWHLQGQWRSMVANQTAPSDAARFALHAAANRDTNTLEAVTSPSAAASLMRLRGTIVDAGEALTIQDLTDAPEPGSVTVDLGRDQVTESGEIEPAIQLGICLEQVRSRWILESVSERGVTCQ